APGVANFTGYPITCSAFTVTPITVGQTVNGMLATSDCTSPINGISYHADRYSFSGVEGQAITIEATSTDINGPLYVYLLHADGTQVVSSGAGYGPPTVVSIRSGGGSFTLSYTDFSAPSALSFLAVAITCAAFMVLPIGFGESKSGTLTVTDCTSPINGSSYHADRYSFDGIEGQEVVITATSSDVSGA